MMHKTSHPPKLPTLLLLLIPPSFFPLFRLLPPSTPPINQAVSALTKTYTLNSQEVTVANGMRKVWLDDA